MNSPADHRNGEREELVGGVALAEHEVSEPRGEERAQLLEEQRACHIRQPQGDRERVVYREGKGFESRSCAPEKIALRGPGKAGKDL